MAFTVRVELHGANAEDYDTLHTEMDARGFSRIIPASDGTRWRLPTGSYAFERTSTCATVRELAAAAASQTRRTFGVLVSETIARCWQGLEQA